MTATLLSMNNYYCPRRGAEVVFFRHNYMLHDAGFNVVPFAMNHRMNVGGAQRSEVVSELEYGGESDGIFTKMRRIAAMPDADVAAAGMAARRRMEDHFSPQRYVERIRAVYARLEVVLAFRAVVAAIGMHALHRVDSGTPHIVLEPVVNA